MDNFQLVKPFSGVAARTNMLKVMDKPEQLISKLVTGDDGIGMVTYSCKEVTRQKGESTEDYYHRVDSEVKAAIRAQLGLKASEPVKYDRLVIKSRTVMFFFIAEYSCSSEQLLEDAKRYGFELDKVAQTILSLRLKLVYINDAASNYNIAPTLYNSELYVGAIAMETQKIKNGDLLVEALGMELYFSKQNEIALSLHKKAFKCSLEDTFIAESEDSSLLFHQGSKTLRAKETLDAVSNAKRPFMAYSLSEKYKDDPKYANKGYENCINYHLTVSLNKLMTVLSDVGVVFKPIQFKADCIIDEFIESNDEYSNDLVIIDAFSSYKSDELRNKFREHLKQTFGTKDVIDVKDAPKPEQFKTEGVSYLVVNEAKKKNGSSIIRTDTGVPLNSFFKALELHLKSKGETSFDYYTSVKIHRFMEKLPSVTQGINIDSVTKAKTPKDDNGNKLPSVTVLK